MVTTKDAERQVVTPPNLQDRINQTVANFNRSLQLLFLFEIISMSPVPERIIILNPFIFVRIICYNHLKKRK